MKCSENLSSHAAIIIIDAIIIIISIVTVKGEFLNLRDLRTSCNEFRFFCEIFFLSIQFSFNLLQLQLQLPERLWFSRNAFSLIICTYTFTCTLSCSASLSAIDLHQQDWNIGIQTQTSSHTVDGNVVQCVCVLQDFILLQINYVNNVFFLKLDSTWWRP